MAKDRTGEEIEETPGKSRRVGVVCHMCKKPGLVMCPACAKIWEMRLKDELQRVQLLSLGRPRNVAVQLRIQSFPSQRPREEIEVQKQALKTLSADPNRPW